MTRPLLCHIVNTMAADGPVTQEARASTTVLLSQGLSVWYRAVFQIYSSVSCEAMTEVTRTTRTPAFWGYPSQPHDYPYYWVILDPKSKEGKVKITNLKNLPKLQIFLILKQTLHATNLLKLLDKMCKYEIDPTSIVEDTERTRFCPQTDRLTDKLKPVYHPFNFVDAGGIITSIHA